MWKFQDLVEELIKSNVLNRTSKQATVEVSTVYIRKFNTRVADSSAI